MPTSIHDRLKFNPSRCANFGSLGSGEITTGNQSAVAVLGICGRNCVSHFANSACGKTRRMTSASPRHGERKSSPEGSYASGQFPSARKNFRAESAASLVSPSSFLPRSEERRVGKECRYRWWRTHEKKKILCE